MGVLDKKKFFILGFGRSGRAVAQLLAQQGRSVHVYDDEVAALEWSLDNTALDGAEDFISRAEAATVEQSLLECDCLVVSPGVPLDHPLVTKARENNLEVTGELEVAYQIFSVTFDASIVGVTGTNGKSTVVNLLGDIFTAGGRRNVVAGNIGTPFSEVVAAEESLDVVVLEISSFQLDTISEFKSDVAVLLNVAADHLDRYQESFDNYAASKARILNGMSKDETFVYNAEDETCRRIAESFPGRKIPFSSAKDLDEGAFRKGDTIYRSHDGIDEPVMPVADFKPVGIHNLENALAAIATATVFGLDVPSIRKGLLEYRPLPHRMELTRVINGVAYINDSKATNVDATIKSIRSIDGDLVLIIGGQDKSGDFKVLRNHLSHVKQAILIGEAREKIRAALKGSCELVDARTMKEAVERAGRTTVAGDTVLLAPACASFDMFKNYAERGECFRDEVASLEK